MQGARPNAEESDVVSRAVQQAAAGRAAADETAADACFGGGMTWDS